MRATSSLFLLYLGWFLLFPFQMSNAEQLLAIDFNTSIKTDRNGYFRCIGGKPNQIADQLVRIGKPSAIAWRIDLDGQAPPFGAGALIPLFDETASCPALPLIDAASWRLNVRLLGNLGSRQIVFETVPNADPQSAGRRICTIKPQDIDPTNWSDIDVPLGPNGIEQERIGFIRAIAEGTGNSWFALDAVRITNKQSDTTPQTNSVRSHSLRTALWVWNTDEILQNRNRCHTLLDFCVKHSISELFCQVPYRFESGEVMLTWPEEFRWFNSAAKSQGIAVHALNGDPKFVFPENQNQVTQWVTEIGAFNAQSELEERFSAIHLDIEPYVLPGWQRPSSRDQLVRDYIALMRQISAMTKAISLPLGIDIPFWWDAVERDGKPAFTYKTSNGAMPILEVLFPLVDNIAVMSYRERVLGNNGVVFHCQTEFELGERFGVDVFAAVELGQGTNVEGGTTFGPYSREYFVGQLTTLRRVLSHTPGCAGIAIHHSLPYMQIEGQP